MNAKQCGLWMLILIVMSILGMPIQAQDDTHTIVYDNIRFSFPSSLATGIQIEAVETNPLSRPDEQFRVGTYPEHIRFNFLDYPGESQFRPPYLIEGVQLLIYSTDAMREFGYDFIDQPDALEVLLQERPDLSTYVGIWDGRSEEGLYLPFLPWINSAQMLRSHPRYVEIAGVGSGIGYLTRYSQESTSHITDQQIFYTFQGIMANPLSLKLKAQPGNAIRVSQPATASNIRLIARFAPLKTA